MRLVTILVFWCSVGAAVAVGLVAASAGAAASPSPVQAYLASVRVPVMAAESAYHDMLVQQVVGLSGGSRAKCAAGIRRDAATFTAIAAKVAAVRAPAVLRSPNSDLGHALRYVAQAARAYAVVCGTASDTPVADGWVGTANDLAKSWRDEVTAQARRGGLSVPFWVKRLAFA